MILSGPHIEREVSAGAIQITPYDSSQVNPASYDLRIGDAYVDYGVFNGSIHASDKTEELDSPLDCKKNNPAYHHKFKDGKLLLLPRRLYLLHTEETVSTHKYVSVIDGKSSIGRLGIVVHLTAGYGDPGFSGQYTLEVTCVHPVWIYAGMRFCQIRFHQLVGEPMRYKGNYTGRSARGPVPSKCFKQFSKG